MSDNEIRTWTNGCWRPGPADPALLAECRQKAQELLERSKTVVFVYVDTRHRPIAKAMLAAAQKDLRQIWFSTNSSSQHVQHVRHDPGATVYAYDPQTYEGIMLTGRAQVEADRTWRSKIWQDGYEKHYTGVDDPDYCILRFDAEWANYYQGTMNATFVV